MKTHARDARIDRIRVASILYILLHHADDYSTQFLRLTPALALVDDVVTWAALASMFAISGYLALKPRASDSVSGWTHTQRRLARLYPPFAIAVVLFQLAGVFPQGWRAVGVNLALLGPWVGPSAATLWFVEVLLYFHLVYAIWLLIKTWRGTPWTIPLFMAAATFGLALAGRTAGLTIDSRLGLYLPAFAGGACLGAALRTPADPHARTRGLAAFVATTVLLGLGAVSVPLWSDRLLPLSVGVSVLTTLLLGALLALPQGEPRPAPRASGFLHRIAYGSFMAYLVHRFVYLYVWKAAAPLGEPWVSVALVASIPLAVAAGVVLQRGYDSLGYARSASVR